MGKTKYNIEDLYDVDIKKFIDIFKVSPYTNTGDMSNRNFYYSKVFNSLSYEEQLELFEVYLLKYFYYIYSNDIRDLGAHTGDVSLGMDLYFSEMSATIKVDGMDPNTDFVLTLEFFESEKEDEKRLVSSFTLWIDDPNADSARAEIGFAWDAARTFHGEQYANKMSDDVFGVLKHVYEQLLGEEELYAWYILNGIDLKHLLLQDGVKYNEWNLAEKLLEDYQNDK